jgi:hypothetical protein
VEDYNWRIVPHQAGAAGLGLIKGLVRGILHRYGRGSVLR